MGSPDRSRRYKHSRDSNSPYRRQHLFNSENQSYKFQSKQECGYFNSERRERQYSQGNVICDYSNEPIRELERFEREKQHRVGSYQNGEKRFDVRQQRSSPFRNYEQQVIPLSNYQNPDIFSPNNAKRKFNKEYSNVYHYPNTSVYCQSNKQRHDAPQIRWEDNRGNPYNRQRFDNSAERKREYYPSHRRQPSPIMERERRSRSYRKSYTKKGSYTSNSMNQREKQYDSHQNSSHQVSTQQIPMIRRSCSKSRLLSLGNTIRRERRGDTSRATGANDHVLQRLTALRTAEKNSINADIHRRIGKIKLISHSLFWRFPRRRHYAGERRDTNYERRFHRDYSDDRRRRKESPMMMMQQNRFQEKRGGKQPYRQQEKEGRSDSERGNPQRREYHGGYFTKGETHGSRHDEYKNQKKGSYEDSDRNKKQLKFGKKSKTQSSPSKGSSSSSSKDSFQSDSKDRSKDAGHYKYKKGETFHNGRYILVRHISDGTFGRVLEVQDTHRQNKLVALKVIRAVKRYVEAAELETEIIEKIQAKDPQNKQRIVRLESTFRHGDNFCMVFEKLGLSLYELLKKNDYVGYNIRLVQSFFKQILQSIGFIHSLRLTHTDLKPENILLASPELHQTQISKPGKVSKSSTYNSSKTAVTEKNTSKFSNKDEDKKNKTVSERKHSKSSSSNSSSRLSSSSSKQSSSSSSSSRSSKSKVVQYWAPASDEIKIIDFGGATFADEHHSDIINTRQYRAPEVILGCCKWNELSDVWSIGCIIMELYSGELFFPTHENYEHLAMIEKTSGMIPKWMAEKAENDKLSHNFKINDEQLAKYHSYYDWPKHATNRKSVQNVRNLLTISATLKPEHQILGDLIQKCLTIDPKQRITCAEALKHEFFKTVFDA